jgi:HEAT repeat protein
MADEIETAVVKETLAEKLGTVPPSEPPKSAPVFYQFVVFPLIIVAVAIALTGFFRWVSSDRRTYDDYLSEIADGWTKKRAEAAYQLEFRLADKDDDLRRQANVPRTIAIFEGAKKDEDPRIRRWLAVVFGHLADPQAVPALLGAVSTEEPDQETRLNATWALGRCRDARAVPALVALLDDPFAGERKAACFALGDIGDHSACDPLAKRLAASGEEIDVRWNVALALARLGDERAVPTLLSMLDRRLLESVVGNRGGEPMSERERQAAIQSVLVNALRGVLALKAVAALERVNALADGDSDLKVREAAMEVRDQLRAKAGTAPVR